MACAPSNNEGSSQYLAAGFSDQDLKALKNFLGSLEKPSSSGTSSLAFSATNPTSCFVDIPEKISPKLWAIDSGATDHMNYNSKSFSSHTPCSSCKKIVLADGSFTTIAGQGDSYISPSLILKNVLHVPKLVSIKKLTMDSDCCVTFFSSHWEFEELKMKRMTGRANERMVFTIWKSKWRN